MLTILNLINQRIDEILDSFHDRIAIRYFLYFYTKISLCLLVD